MRILYDHQVFSWQKFGGISRYHAELFSQIRGMGQEPFLPTGFYGENLHLLEIAQVPVHPIVNFSFPGKKHLQNYLGKSKSLNALHNEKPAIFHPTYYDPYFLGAVEKQGVPFVVTVHDMIHELFGHGSGWFSLDAGVVEGKKKMTEQAAAIVCVSENTKRDLLRAYPNIPPEKVRVIWHGNSLKPTENQGHSMDLPERYVLFVGNRSAYKNFENFVRQLAPWLLGHEGMHLVCAGGGAFSEKEEKLLESLQLFSRSKQVYFRGDAELCELYQRAFCFVFPSLYEGFGIPVLESFANACPVVLNRASSLPEVGGEAALYYEAGQPASLPECLEKLYKNPPLRDSLIKKGFEQLGHFTWENSAKQHLELYNTVLNH